MQNMEMQAISGQVFNESDANAIKQMAADLHANLEAIKKLKKKVQDVME